MSEENETTVRLSMFEFVCIIGGLWTVALGVYRIAAALERAHPAQEEK